MNMTTLDKAKKAFEILETASKNKLLNDAREADIYNDSKRLGIEFMSTTLAKFYDWRKLAI